MLSRYEKLNINSVNTSRAFGSAGSFFILSDVSGDEERLKCFADDIAAKPWFEPGGKRITPATVVDLKAFAPDRTRLLRDLLGVISIDHGVNIETMANRTFAHMYDDGFDLLRTGDSGLETGGGTGGGGTGTGGTGGGAAGPVVELGLAGAAAGVTTPG